MITITITDEEISVLGHAGAGPPGHDIVCASISTLVQTLNASVERLTDQEFQSDLRRGFAFIEYFNGTTPETKLLVESFFIGVCGVAGASPEHVTVIDGRRGTEAPGGAEKATVDPGGSGGKHEE